MKTWKYKFIQIDEEPTLPKHKTDNVIYAGKRRLN